jgi:hypothetical protein
MRHAADGEAMADYGGIVIITREPDLADAPFYREQHSAVGRFVAHREGDDGSFLEASPVEMWDDVDEAIAWGRGRAPVVVVRLGNTIDTIYSAGEAPAPEARPWPPT